MITKPYKVRYRLPSGKITSNYEKYSSEWRKLAKPLEDAIGYELLGFDPGFIFSSPDMTNTFSCSTYVARKISEALSKK